MLDHVRDLQVALQRLKSALPKGSKARVRTDSVRNSARQLVDDHFRHVRPSLIAMGVSAESVQSLDQYFQELLELTHRQTNASVYRTTINAASNGLIAIERMSIQSIAPPSAAPIGDADAKIIATLASLLPTASSAYRQAMIDLQTSHRHSWRGPVTDLREALRETLDHLAPDAAVKSQPGFKLEPDTRGPTMKQKVRYILSNRGMSKSATASTEDAVDAIEGMLGAFVRSVYTRSSVSTHTAGTKEEALKVRQFVRVALCELLEIHI